MKPRKTKRASSGVPATKWLITAASVAGVLGGWAAFSLQSTSSLDPTSRDLATSLQLAPVPTVVQAPGTGQDQIIPGSLSAASSSNQTTLRSVTAVRPAPITITRSSR
jgi:hypothetical protein